MALAFPHAARFALPLLLALEGCLLIRPPPPANPEPDDPAYASRDRSAERGPLYDGRGEPPGPREERALPDAREMTRGRTTDAPVVYGSKSDEQARAAPLPKADPLTPTTIEVRSDCTEPVSIAYGRGLLPDQGARARISPGTRRNPPREPDGSLMVWILDRREEVISSVRAEPTTTRVVIEKSCTKLRAD